MNIQDRRSFLKAGSLVTIGTVVASSLVWPATATAQEECKCSVKLKCPEEVPENDKDAEFSAEFSITGDCGRCFSAGQITILRDGDVKETLAIPSKDAKNGEGRTVDLSKVTAKAKEGDVLVVCVDLVCVKDKRIVCKASDCCLIKVGKKK